mgnify:CR=1 FL=1
MKRIWIVLSLIPLLGLMGCGVKSSQAYYSYDSKIISSEKDGTYNIRACGRGRNAVVAYEEAKKQAVYDVVFNGVVSGNGQINSLRPLMTDMNAKEKYEDYFNAFFAEKGAYAQFASLKDRRILSSDWNRNKMQVLAQVSVTVDRAALKKKLIEDNILKTE